MKAKANLSRTLVVAAVVVVAVAVALFGVGLRTAEPQESQAATTQTTNIQVRDLGTLGGSRSYASAINDSGQVVGYSYTASGEKHAFLYDGTNGMKDLGTDGTYSYASDINNSGQVVGSTVNGRGEEGAFLYDSTNGMQDIKDLLPADFYLTLTSARAINSDGQIAADTSYCGVILTPAATATPATYEVQEDLCALANDSSFPLASDINDAGRAVGAAVVSWDLNGIPTNWYGFLYDEGATPRMRNLGNYSSLSSINNFGKAVGGGSIYDSVTQQWQNLGTIGGCSSGNAYDINDFDQVVGVWHTCDGSPRAFLKESAKPMIDLNSLIPADSGWTIRYASAINNDGKIAATGYKAGGEDHALLLTPTSDVPPPDDTEAPSAPTISSPQNNTYLTDGSFSVSGNAEASSTVELFEGTTSKGTTKADSTSGAWSIDLSGVSEGSHTYTAKATDAAGNTSSTSDSVRVTVDKSAPTVDSVIPKEDATGVAPAANVTATFSEGMQAASVKSAFKLYKKGTTIALAASVNYEAASRNATLDPSSNLKRGTTYQAVVSVGAQDLAGNSLDQNASLSGSQQKVWFFKVRN